MDIFKHCFEVNIIEDIINLMPIMLFLYLHVFVYKPNFPELSQ